MREIRHTCPFATGTGVTGATLSTSARPGRHRVTGAPTPPTASTPTTAPKAQTILRGGDFVWRSARLVRAMHESYQYPTWRNRIRIDQQGGRSSATG